MKISRARVAAYEILKRIETDHALSANLLPQYESNLSPRDAALAHELVLGALRRQIYLDRHIEAHSGKKKTDPEITVALRLGLYQLYFLSRIPAHSAINESVELAKYARKRSAAGFINGILRSAERERRSLSFESKIEQISYETSHPVWLLEKWVRDFGVEAAHSIAVANNRVPTLTFRRTKKGIDHPLDLSVYSESQITQGCFSADRLDDDLRRMSGDGLIYFQDEGSQMIANSIDLTNGGRFLDVCASPGGKATVVAANYPDVTIIAGDLTARRIDTLVQVVEKQGADVQVVRYDAERNLPYAESSFDAVLVDAPCSGTGTIRHNPEIRYRVKTEDLSRLRALQLSILENSANVVVSGGTLTYTTCSLELEENERVIDAFLAKREDFEPITPLAPEEFLRGNRSLRTWPHLHEMDGFFLSTMRRR